MKIKWITFTLFISLPALSAPFQNLGFDNAPLLLESFKQGIEAKTYLPGWQLLRGTQLDERTSLNSPGTLGLGGYTSLYNMPDLSQANPLRMPVEGFYSFGMRPSEAGLDPELFQFLPSILLQSGDVPSDSKSLRFKAFLNVADIYVNGNLLPLITEPLPADYPDRPQWNAAADISFYAGQMIELKIVTPNHRTLDVYGIDSLRFSPLPVPEPSTIALGALSGAFLLFQKMKYKKDSI